MAAAKVGRNDPCPCGSGQKYKRCCAASRSTWVVPSAPPEVLHAFMEHQAKEKARIARYGEIRPQIAMDFHGYKFVVVGGTLHYSKRWRFFPDFLQDYLPSVFGKEWGEAELAKPFEDRHQAVQFRKKCLEFLGRQQRNAEGFYAAVPNGDAAAYFNLAYDLYTVQDNARLDEDLLARLKHRDHFQGARHELFAEATCLRAGFQIEHENGGRRTRHAEFVATHKTIGQNVSVEAKSKHRPGVLGRPGEPEPEHEISLRFGGLINDAIRKNPSHPLVIFLDT